MGWDILIVSGDDKGKRDRDGVEEGVEAGGGEVGGEEVVVAADWGKAMRMSR